ncbi:hypothetical protein LPB136_06095 [Tenacibaculum todarodis]|uniref:Leucine-binding protein domain-containing protein n=1 Tax=Tenacibaculum todarodis TaxID=1850252 RepID=A0A1L3JIP2_9FLAO|nr:ABC transporter substrate-binding protein [Tenacibaculum todarodis]APG64953.1 hypothetical protein LPB136_06095 [Tenacibaculum todarodis]
MSIKVGILIPRSDMFPTLGKDFINGLSLAFNKEDAVNITYIIEGVGNATDESVLRIAEKFILQEQVDITLGFCGSNLLERIIKLYDSYKEPFIHLDLGGILLETYQTSPYVVHHTLNLWQSSFIAGKYAANNIGKKGAFSTSYYDGGYHLLDAFIRGYTSEGGEIVHNYVSNVDYDSETFETNLITIQELKPNVVFALFSYKEADKFFNAVQNSPIDNSIPIISIPLMVDEYYMKNEYNLSNVYSIASWSFNDDSSKMTLFKEQYLNKYNQQPNIFSLLGNEAYEIIKVFDLNYNDKKIATILKKNIVTTCRGKITYNTANESEIKQYILRQFKYAASESEYQNRILSRINKPASFGITKERASSLTNSGWKNPYICT